MAYKRGAVVKGPDVFGPHSHRPYVCLSDGTHPFSDEEALYAAVTTTHRPLAIPLREEDFSTGSPTLESYVADIVAQEGQLTEELTETIAQEAAGYLGVH